jgi:hypothetical protein
MNLPLHALRNSLVLASALLLLSPGTGRTEEKIILGGVEEVFFVPWRITLPARVDTGAASSSLDVCEMKVRLREVRFRLPDRCGGVQVTLPLVARRHIKATEGETERRPVVEIEICLGGRHVRTQFTLNDRSKMRYPVLIGRRTLDGGFLVDTSLQNTRPPLCLEGHLP